MSELHAKVVRKRWDCKQKMNDGSKYDCSLCMVNFEGAPRVINKLKSSHPTSLVHKTLLAISEVGSITDFDGVYRCTDCNLRNLFRIDVENHKCEKTSKKNERRRSDSHNSPIKKRIRRDKDVVTSKQSKNLCKKSEGIERKEEAGKKTSKPVQTIPKAPKSCSNVEKDPEKQEQEKLNDQKDNFVVKLLCEKEREVQEQLRAAKKYIEALVAQGRHHEIVVAAQEVKLCHKYLKMLEELQRTFIESANKEKASKKVDEHSSGDCENVIWNLNEMVSTGVIAAGAQGEVERVHSKSATFALKRIDLSKLSGGFRDGVNNELELYKSGFTSPFCVTPLQIFESGDQLTYLLPLMHGGALNSYLIYDGLSDNIKECHEGTVDVLARIAMALEAVHAAGYIFGDLKPRNIGIDEDGKCRLLDFGVVAKGSASGIRGIYDYAAPEMFQNADGTYSKYGKEVDFFALGILACEVCCGRAPMQFASNALDPQEFKDDLIEFVKAKKDGSLIHSIQGMEKMSPLLRDFAARLMSPMPCRLGANGGWVEIKSHEIFSNINFETLYETDSPLKAKQIAMRGR